MEPFPSTVVGENRNQSWMMDVACTWVPRLIGRLRAMLNACKGFNWNKMEQPVSYNAQTGNHVKPEAVNVHGKPANGCKR